MVSATQNLAGALAERQRRRDRGPAQVRDESYFPLDPRVSVRVLSDMRPHSPVSRRGRPAVRQVPADLPAQRRCQDTRGEQARGTQAPGVPGDHRRRRGRQLQPGGTRSCWRRRAVTT
ncbi:hypothetical protein LV779_28260 [Streptomyces thinghirensis]|nr:hypothetical protein [Streptomyces thinghirensis]